MALPWGSDAYGTRKASSDRAKNPHKAYVSTHAIKITADDANWFVNVFGTPKDKTQTLFHRMRMMLAKAENENKDLRKQLEELDRQCELLKYQTAQNLLDQVETRPLDELDKEIKEGKLMF